MKYYKFISLLNKRVKEDGCANCTYEITDAVLKSLSELVLDILLEDDQEKVSIPRFVVFKTRDAQIRKLPNGNIVEPHKKMEVCLTDFFQDRFVEEWKLKNLEKDGDEE